MSFSDKLRDSVDEITDHYNDQHADTVLFIARQYLGYKDADEAQIRRVESDRACFSITSAKGAIEHEILLPVTVTSREQVSENFLNLLRQARQAAGSDVPQTSIEVELKQTASLLTYRCEVKSCEWITPAIRQVTFRGLDSLVSPGWDAFMFVMVPEPGEMLHADFDMAAWRRTPVDKRTGGAYYTIREQRGPEIDMWFVIHEAYGRVSNWAGQAKPGDSVAMWGPRFAFKPPPGTSSYLLLGDETAYPAIGAIIEALPSKAAVTAILESNGDIVRLRDEPHWNIHWIERKTSDSSDQAILRALRQLPSEIVDGCYIFGAAEAAQMRSVRRHLKERGVHRTKIHLTGYWRRS